jgi:hypothetical protein
MSTNKYAPTSKGFRQPLDNGPGPEGKIANPPRFAEIGGLTGASKIAKHKNVMRVKKPGSGN